MFVYFYFNLLPWYIFFRTNFIYEYIAYCIPTVLLFISNVWLVIQVARARRRLNDNGQNNDKTKRLTLTMMLVSLSSLITYPVSLI